MQHFPSTTLVLNSPILFQLLNFYTRLNLRVGFRPSWCLVQLNMATDRSAEERRRVGYRPVAGFGCNFALQKVVIYPMPPYHLHFCRYGPPICAAVCFRPGDPRSSAPSASPSSLGHRRWNSDWLKPELLYHDSFNHCIKWNWYVICCSFCFVVKSFAQVVSSV